ncbi:MAG: archaetidylserine decarboxylase [Gammaproteobacteria bacterium]
MNWKIHQDSILPQHLVSHIFGWLSNRKTRWLKLWLIRWFIRHYNINMDEVAVTDLDAYPTFNAFFARHLRPEARPIVHDEHAIVSPVDGELSAFGTIKNAKLIQAKRYDYQLTELIIDDKLAMLLENGSYCTLYLSPKNYHRVHMPMTGQLTRMTYVPGYLFSVNQSRAEHIPKLYARNERVICEFNCLPGKMVVVLVGAYRVGNIVTRWHGLVAPQRKRQIQTWDYSQQHIVLYKGQELGYFGMGSTVILLFPPMQIKWHPSIHQHKLLRMGEWLAYSM